MNPSCAAVCPSGAIYKREEDGIVLIDQEKCRGWRMCVSGCPYKKIYYNWQSGKSEKCNLLLSAHRGGTADCLLRDLRRADPLSRRAAVRRRPDRGSGERANEQDLYEAQLGAVSRSERSGIRRTGASGRRAGIVARGGQALAGLEDGDGLESRLPPASGVPNSSMVLVHPPAQPDPVGRRGRRDRRRRGSDARCPLAAHPLAISRQPAYRRRRDAGRVGASACWRRACSCGASTSTACSTRACSTGSGCLNIRSRRCTGTWRSPITRIALSSRPATRSWATRPTTSAAPAGSPSARAAAKATARSQPVRPGHAQDARRTRVMKRQTERTSC